MSMLQIVVLAIVQGLTEFLPVSSSAHLILVPVVADWPDQGLAMDVAVHLGSLLAVMIYFRRELTDMTTAWFASVFKRQHSQNSQLAWAVIFGTIPLVLAGFLLKDLVDTVLRSPMVIAIATIGWGALLWLADAKGQQARDEYTLTVKDYVLIGLSQAAAIIPGTSRSGATMTVGLMLGLTRKAAARFSFLLSVPAILMASAYHSLKLATGDEAVNWEPIAIGIVLSGVCAYLCIHVFLKALDVLGMLPFVIYRFLLGGVLLALIFAGVITAEDTATANTAPITHEISNAQ